MRRRALAAGVLSVVVLAVACSDEPEIAIPVRDAPPSRHGAMRDALASEARSLAFDDGDWWGDLGDAPFYGLAWLAHRQWSGEASEEDRARGAAALERARRLFAEELLEGDLQEKVMAALGVIELVSAGGDAGDLQGLDSFVDRLDSLVSTLGDYLGGVAEESWAIRTYGPTSVTALVALLEAQYAAHVGGPRAADRRERALAIDRAIVARAHDDLVDVSSGRAARGYAFAPGRPELFLYPNVAMLMLKARLFRLTRDPAFRLEARAIYAAIQPLKLSDAPARYASPYAAAALGTGPRGAATLSSQNYVALALSLLFEITGETRFVEEADRVLDGIEQMRGAYCLSDVHDVACEPGCGPGQACVTARCTADRCATGLLHHLVDGRLAERGEGTLFCAGCNLQTLYVLGYRRALAREAF
jgi:hypothetical protein